MEKLKSYGLAAAVCSAALIQLASGDASFTVGVNKKHYFTSAVTARFGGGDFSVHLVDGGFVASGCFGLNGGPFPIRVPVNPIACPLGTTAYIVGGDINGDGVQDIAAYWSISSPVRAVYAEPFRPDQTSLYAFPGKIPPLSNFKDASKRIYFNLFDPDNFTQYNISEYSVSRGYAAGAEGSKSGLGALTEMNKEVPPGQYTFRFPGVKQNENVPDYFQYPGVVIGTFVEAFGTGRYNSGFRFTSGLWDNQYYQMDPRVTTKFKWVGNTADVIRNGIDSLKLAVFKEGGELAIYPVEQVDPTDDLFYVDLGSSLTTSYIMPSTVFRVGDRTELSVKFDRYGAALRPASSDDSVRDFRAKLKMVDSYAGYATLNFPQGSVANKLTATADFDGDKVSNLIEYAAEYPTSEQISAANIEQGAVDGTVIGFGGGYIPPVQDKTKTGGLVPVVYVDKDTKQLVCDVPKRPFSGATLVPSFEVSVPSSGTVVRYKKISLNAASDYYLDYNASTEDPSVPDPINPDPLGDPEEVTKNMRVSSLDDNGLPVITEQDVTVTIRQPFWRLRSKKVFVVPADGKLPEFKATVTAKAIP